MKEPLTLSALSWVVRNLRDHPTAGARSVPWLAHLRIAPVRDGERPGVTPVVSGQCTAPTHQASFRESVTLGTANRKTDEAHLAVQLAVWTPRRLGGQIDTRCLQGCMWTV